MTKNQILDITTKICEIAENIVGNENMSVDVGCILVGDDIDKYSIETINESSNGKIAVEVKFHTICGNTWHGKYYFFDMCKHDNIIVAHNCIKNLIKDCVIRCKDCDEILYQSKNNEIQKAYDFIKRNKSSYKTLTNLTCDGLNESLGIKDGSANK